MNNLYDNTCDCSAIPDLADNKDDWDNIYNEIVKTTNIKNECIKALKILSEENKDRLKDEVIKAEIELLYK